jgi:hypothetical protein
MVRWPIKEEIALMLYGPSMTIGTTGAFEEVCMLLNKWRGFFPQRDPSVVERQAILVKNHSLWKRSMVFEKKESGCKDSFFLIFL